MQPTTGRIHSFESFGTVDGPGLRCIVFFQGCPLRCRYCHNPDTWDPAGGIQTTAEEVADRVERCRSYIAKGGVTLSGGEPLMQPDFALELLQRLRAMKLHTAIDTSGCMPIEIAAPAIDAADMVLLDIKALDPAECFELTGRDNSNALATLEHCERTSKRVWIRHVIVPGSTLDARKIRNLAAYLRPYKCVERIELLPFSKLGEYKWKQLGLHCPLASVPAPTQAEIDAANEALRQ